MRVKKSVRTIYIPREELQTKNTTLACGKIRVTTSALGPITGAWEGNVGVWVEYKAVRTFTVKGKRRK